MPYALFVLVGTTLWQTFADAATAPLKVVSEAKPLLAKINFPREALDPLGPVPDALRVSLEGAADRGGTRLVRCTARPSNRCWRWASRSLLIWLGIVIGLALTPLGMLITDVSSMLTLGTAARLLLDAGGVPASPELPVLAPGELQPREPIPRREPRAPRPTARSATPARSSSSPPRSWWRRSSSGSSTGYRCRSSSKGSAREPAGDRGRGPRQEVLPQPQALAVVRHAGPRRRGRRSKRRARHAACRRVLGDPRPVVRAASRRDAGLIGPNGAGKTTLLRILTG